MKINKLAMLMHTQHVLQNLIARSNPCESPYFAAQADHWIVTVPHPTLSKIIWTPASRVLLEINGDELKLKSERQRPKLAELLAATPEGQHRAEGWDVMTSAGNEL